MERLLFLDAQDENLEKLFDRSDAELFSTLVFDGHMLEVLVLSSDLLLLASKLNLAHTVIGLHIYFSFYYFA